MKTYASKDEVYQDFPIALKFSLGKAVHIRDYDKIVKAFSKAVQAKITAYDKMLKNYRTEYPLSVGMFVEVPVTGDTGQTIGTRFVLLEHETGWEVFIPLASALAGWLGAKAADVVTSKALEYALGEILNFMQDEWPQLHPVAIDHVEIRTEEKGIMRIPFSNFQISQIECLLKEFQNIRHISECNKSCFNGMLVAPITGEIQRLASD